MTPDKTTFSVHEMHAICIKSDDKIAKLEAEIERLKTSCGIVETDLAWRKEHGKLRREFFKMQARAEAAEKDLDGTLGTMVKMSHRISDLIARAEAAEDLLADCKAGYRTALATMEAAEALNKEMAEMLREIRSDGEQDSCPKRGEDFPLYSDNCLPPYLPEPEGE